MTNRPGRIIKTISGTCGFLLAILALLALTGRELPLPILISPSLLIKKRKEKPAAEKQTGVN